MKRSPSRRRGALAALVALGLGACRTVPDYNRELPFGAAALILVEREEARPDLSEEWFEREEILPALARSIQWTRSQYAAQFFPIEGITQERALASLERFEELLLTSSSAAEFGASIDREFDFYRSAGWDGRGGGVLFTGYCTPILDGSVERLPGYDHPLYALPPDLVKDDHGRILGRATPAGGTEPYPTRRTIEARALLSGQELELVWMKNPIDAYLAHVNGSAFIRLADGEFLRLGYAGNNGHEYTSLGRELVESGELREGDVNLRTIREWAEASPDQVASFLHRNDRYVFFTPIEGNPRGSLNLEVTGGRTIATDKRLFPRGALVFVDTELPSNGRDPHYRRLMLDQDTGGAIRTAGRADLYLGVGDEAERLAGTTRLPGEMFYLFLREERGFL